MEATADIMDQERPKTSEIDEEAFRIVDEAIEKAIDAVSLEIRHNLVSSTCVTF